MKRSVVVVEDSYDRDTLPILVVGDVHLGLPGVEKVLLKTFETVAKQDAKMIFVGDFFELYLRNDIEQHQEVRPLQEVKMFLRTLVNDYAEYILGVVRGNHDARLARSGDDILYDIFIPAQVPYSVNQLLLILTLKNAPSFNILVTHGVGGSATLGGRINAGKRYADGWNDVDAVVYGHFHAEVSAVVAKREYVSAKRYLGVRHTRLVCASALIPDTHYSYTLGLPPSPATYQYLVLSADPWSIGYQSYDRDYVWKQILDKPNVTDT